MKSIAIELLCLALLAGAVSAGSPRPTASNATRAAAVSGLPEFVAHIPPGMASLYGFEPGDDLTALRPGTPWQRHTIPPASIVADSAAKDAASVLQAADLWVFPVLTAQGAPRCVLLVERCDGIWRAVSLGQPRLARQLAELDRLWPRAAGHDVRLVEIPQAKAYFATVLSEPAANLTPLAELAGGVQPLGTTPRLQPLAATMQALRRELQANGAWPGGDR